jgi:hypothetical protein
MRGQILPDVQWMLPSGGSGRGADRVTPSMGDRVVLSYGLGYPIILGFLPKPQSGEFASLSISSGEQSIDTGLYGPSSDTYGDKSKPKDLISGDRILSTVGGSFLALLRGGSTVIRAGRGAEMLMSNLTGLVRIVSRNWAHFTDLSSDVIRNYKGRLYRYTGYSKDFLKAKSEDYNLHFHYGDVALSETAKTNYDSYTGTPTSTSIIYKEQVTQTTPTPLEFMHRSINDVGEEEVIVNNGTHITRVSSTAEQIQITWNNQNTVTINEASIHAVHKDGADLIMDHDGIRGSFSSGLINMQSANIVVSFGGSSVTLTDGDITLTNGSGFTLISPGLTRLSNGGHSVNITSGGVAIS